MGLSIRGPWKENILSQKLITITTSTLVGICSSNLDLGRLRI